MTALLLATVLMLPPMADAITEYQHEQRLEQLHEVNGPWVGADDDGAGSAGSSMQSTEHRGGGKNPQPSQPRTFAVDQGAVEQWRSLVTAACDWNPDQALAVIYGESRGVETAENPSGASGLFQIMDFWSESFGLDPHVAENNVYMACVIWQSGHSGRGGPRTFSHWVVQGCDDGSCYWRWEF